MTDWNSFEEKRLSLQAELDAGKTALERNKSGQFATPTELAREIVRFGLRLLGENKPVRFMDPGIGTGSFYSALRSLVHAKRVRRAFGYEIDPHYSVPARKLWKRFALEIREQDFTEQTPAKDDLVNLLICNPPYVRHHHIDGARKLPLQHLTERSCGVKINGLSGLYCYFLGLSHQWMSPGAVAGWLIPSEFMDVNYGAQVKRYLLRRVTLVRIHRFNPSDVQFDDALVSSAVVWIRNEPPGRDHEVTFSYGGTHTNPDLVRNVPSSELEQETKWTRYPMLKEAAKRPTVTLGDLFTIKRGIATGDNRFFILTEAEIEDRQLPKKFFRPILPSSRDIPTDKIEAHADGSPALQKRLFLLDVKIPEDEIKANYPSLWRYLETGKQGSESVSTRYLCRTRRLWYAQEDRPAPPFICTYMGRNRAGGRPFRFILNLSKAIATNVFLLIYPKNKLATLLEEDPDIKETVWQYLNSIDIDELLGSGRVYGGGLHKMEPRELKSVSAEDLVELLPALKPTLEKQTELFQAYA